MELWVRDKLKKLNLEENTMATTADEVWQLLGELVASQKETDRRMQETDRQIRAVNKELGDGLGEFVQWQVRPAIRKLFQERGINVRELSFDISIGSDSQEIDGCDEEVIEVDLLVVDTTQAVAIAVKSRLTQKDVDEHLERLGKFKRLLPRYENIQLLGAVAAMVAPSEVTRYAYRQGLFVMTQSGEDLVILNDAKFRPKQW